MLIIEAIEQFKFHCKYEKNLDPNTLRAYNIDITQFSSELSNYKLTNIDKNHLKKYIENLYDNKYKIKTIKRKIAVIKAFFNFLEFEDIITVNPFRKMRLSLKEPKILPITLDIKEIEIILKHIQEKAKYSINKPNIYKHILKDLVVIEILFSTGMRVSELSNLTKKDINVKTGSIKIFGKGSKERIIHICDNRILTIIKEYIRLFDIKNHESTYFLINKIGKRMSEQSIRLMIKRYRNEIAFSKHITPHTFRHTFATLLLEEGVDIRYIQTMLGHSAITTTQIYTKVSSEHQRKILKAKHPRKKIKILL